VQIGARAANVPFISVANAPHGPMPMAIRNADAADAGRGRRHHYERGRLNVGGETALLIALHPGMALREVTNADRDDGGVAHAKVTYREHNWFTLRTTSGLEFTTSRRVQRH
jgi:hypothetical protein